MLFVGRLLVLLLVVGRASAAALPAFSSLARSQWVQFSPDETASSCFDGGPYSFWVRRGVSDTKLLIYFAGGGACWNEATCRGEYTDPVTCQAVGFTDIDYTPAMLVTGIVNGAEADNPFKDYSGVLIQYCSADVFLGNRSSVTYGTDTYKHLGALNVNVTLQWVQTNMQPDTIAIVGYSAGGYGSILWAPSLEMMFPSAKIVVLGDAFDGASIQGANIPDLWAQWGAVNDYYTPMAKGVLQSTSANSSTITQTVFQALLNATRITFTQVNALDDQNQVLFNRAFTGRNTSTWRLSMVTTSAYLQTLPRFYAYLMPGSFHGILSFNSMYSMTVNGVKLIDWVSALMSGSGSSVVCPTCTPAAVAALNAGSCAGSGSTTLCSNSDVAIVGGTCDCTDQSEKQGNACGDKYEVCGSKAACQESALNKLCNALVQSQMLKLMGDKDVSADCSTLLSQAMTLDTSDIPAVDAKMSTFCQNQCFVQIAQGLIQAGCGAGDQSGFYGLLAGAYEKQCKPKLSSGAHSLTRSLSGALSLVCVGASLLTAHGFAV